MDLLYNTKFSRDLHFVNLRIEKFANNLIFMNWHDRGSSELNFHDHLIFVNLTDSIILRENKVLAKFKCFTLTNDDKSATFLEICA